VEYHNISGFYDGWTGFVVKINWLNQVGGASVIIWQVTVDWRVLSRRPSGSRTDTCASVSKHPALHSVGGRGQSMALRKPGMWSRSRRLAIETY